MLELCSYFSRICIVSLFLTIHISGLRFCTCLRTASAFSFPENKQRQVCVIDDGLFQKESRSIASSLCIPVFSDLSHDSLDSCTHALELIPYEYDDISTFALGIKTLTDARKNPRKKPPKSKPYIIDFFPQKNSRMGKRTSGESGTDLLVKAVAPRRKDDFTIYDLTAGFGQDSLILAQNPAVSDIYMVERDPIVASLLEDGLRRLKLLSEQSEVAEDLSCKLHLRNAQGIDVLISLTQKEEQDRPDICYLDPMFPPRQKSAAVKKGMQILHGLLNTQQTGVESLRLEEERQLLEAAIQVSNVRVVVKRPAKAPPLGGEEGTIHRPSYTVEGSVNRWDIYVK